MSGLEVVGIAASIIQIADLGTKLSVKLFSFYRQIQNANQAIQHLSSDIALTCAILRELGDSLKQDETSKLCSPEAHLTARQMLKQCEQVLRQIQTMIDESHTSGKSRWQQATSKIRNVLNEPDMNRVRENLERLKSTMLLLLNVIMFAGQIRRNHIPEVLNEQRNLIETLLKEKTHVETAHVGTIDSNPTICLASLPQTAGPAISFQKNALTVSDQELQDYNSLIRAMLGEIDGCKSKLEKSRHSRIRDGVLNVHSSEIVHFQRNYGSSVFQYFDDSVFDDSIISQSVTTGNLDISPDPLPENNSKRPRYDHMGSYFSPLCSPALRPRDLQAADLSGVTFSDLSVSQQAVRPERKPRISPNLQPMMDYRDDTSQDTFDTTKTIGFLGKDASGYNPKHPIAASPTPLLSPNNRYAGQPLPYSYAPATSAPSQPGYISPPESRRILEDNKEKPSGRKCLPSIHEALGNDNHLPYPASTSAPPLQPGHTAPPPSHLIGRSGAEGPSGPLNPFSNGPATGSLMREPGYPAHPNQRQADTSRTSLAPINTQESRNTSLHSLNTGKLPTQSAKTGITSVSGSQNSLYEQIINGTQIPGVSYPTITSTGLTSKRTSHKIAEQGRRNRFKCASKELKALIPATFIRDKQNQTQASSCVKTGEKEVKEIRNTSSITFLLEMAIHYIKEFQLGLKEPDPSVETDTHAKLGSERDALEVSRGGPRKRINAALKEIESLIPSDFVGPRLVKDNAISDVKPEGHAEKESKIQTRSKAKIVEMAVDYIKEIQQKLEGTSDTLALRLIPPLAPSPNGDAEPSGEVQRSESTGGQDDPLQVNSRMPKRPMIPTEEVSISDTALPAPRNLPSTGDSKSCEAETTQDDDLRERVCLADAGEDIEAQTQRYKTHVSTTKIRQFSHKDGWSYLSDRRKRRFSAVDTPNTAAMVFKPLIEDNQGMSESIQPEDSPLEVSGENHSELFTDLSWPSSFEKALKQWTNLEKNEINMGIPGLITLGI